MVVMKAGIGNCLLQLSIYNNDFYNERIEIKRELFFLQIQHDVRFTTNFHTFLNL